MPSLAASFIPTHYPVSCGVGDRFCFFLESTSNVKRFTVDRAQNRMCDKDTYYNAKLGLAFGHTYTSESTRVEFKFSDTICIYV